MSKKPAQLNQRQADVLKGIKDGRPAAVYARGYEHRVVARALERRGLITISARGPTWTAASSWAGQDVLT
jgi:hypothetical protein